MRKGISFDYSWTNQPNDKKFVYDWSYSIFEQTNQIDAEIRAKYSNDWLTIIIMADELKLMKRFVRKH